MLGYTSKYCSICEKSTPHRMVRGEGCVAKICLRCEGKAQHPYAKELSDENALPAHFGSRTLVRLPVRDRKGDSL